MNDSAAKSVQARMVIPTGFIDHLDSPQAKGYVHRVYSAESSTASDGVPIPPKRLWRGYGDTVERYLELGRDHAASLTRILASARVSLSGQQVLDFGCGAGPVMRFLKERARDTIWWGCDIDPVAIEWCRANFPAEVRFFTNTTAPHLPVIDGFFGVIYACSVFTHIDHGADAWLLELARSMQPGGTLCASIHDEDFIQNTLTYAPDWLFSRRLANEREMLNNPSWRKVVLGGGHAQSILYRRDFFLQMAAPVFDCVDVVPRGYGNQTVLVLRRR